MNRRRAALLLATALSLFGALHLLVFGLYRGAANTVHAALRDHLDALGRTAARTLSATAGDEAEPLLRALTEENRLEDAYLLSPRLRLLAGARLSADSPANLMRLDPAGLAQAFAGQTSIHWGYALGDTAIETGFFPVGSRPGEVQVLVLEAGRSFRAPASHLRFLYGVAAAVSLLLTALFAGALLLGVRSLERARLAHGRAERLAAVGQMAAMVAHEVRNPLGILRAQAELLREGRHDSPDDRAEERIADMLGEIDRIRRLTDEFLTLSRDAPLERAPCDLARLIADLVEDVRLSPAAADARIALELPAGLPVEADPSRLRQLLLNLLGNALAARESVTVTVSARAQRREVIVQVADDGPGVDAALRPALFQAFVSGRPGGSGLGLAIARRIAEQHGGSLVLEPARPHGGGATFTLRLPQAASRAGRRRRWTLAPAPVSEQPEGERWPTS